MLPFKSKRCITTILRSLLIIMCCAIGLQLAGCSKKNASEPNDPYESLNRHVFALNNGIDAISLRPAAVVYTHVTPGFLRRMIHRFFINLDNVPTIVNDVLQGKGTFAASDTWRLIFNSTIGVGGFFDPAAKIGLPPHNNDFSLTLYQWGAKKSPYLMVPLLGPSTFRGGVGDLADLFVFSAWPYINPRSTYYTLLTLWFMDKRAQLLPADQLIQQAFDPYVFVRNAFFQMRQQEIADNQLSYATYKSHYEEQHVSVAKADPSTPHENQA